MGQLQLSQGDQAAQVLLAASGLDEFYKYFDQAAVALCRPPVAGGFFTDFAHLPGCWFPLKGLLKGEAIWSYHKGSNHMVASECFFYCRWRIQQMFVCPTNFMHDVAWFLATGGLSRARNNSCFALFVCVCVCMWLCPWVAWCCLLNLDLSPSFPGDAHRYTWMWEEKLKPQRNRGKDTCTLHTHTHRFRHECMHTCICCAFVWSCFLFCWLHIRTKKCNEQHGFRGFVRYQHSVLF